MKKSNRGSFESKAWTKRLQWYRHDVKTLNKASNQKHVCKELCAILDESIQHLSESVNTWRLHFINSL
jgi:recombinational DNA repair ATPase RecF